MIYGAINDPTPKVPYTSAKLKKPRFSKPSFFITDDYTFYTEFEAIDMIMHAMEQ